MADRNEPENMSYDNKPSMRSMQAQRPASAAAVAFAPVSAARPASAAPANAAQAIARMDESNREILQGMLARTAQPNARRDAQAASMGANASNANCSTCRALTSVMGHPFQCHQCRMASSLPSAAAQAAQPASVPLPLSSAASAAAKPCEFPIWAALTQSQRACFMDGAANIVKQPVEGPAPGIRNRAVETLLAAFFEGAVPTKDPCPQSIPADTPANREAAWAVLCTLLPGDQKGALRDEALDFAVFHDPVILSDGNTYGRAPLMEWFANSPTDPNGTPVTPAERAGPTPNTRLKRFIDTFNLGGSPERQDMLGGRKSTRRRKSKSARHRIRRMCGKTKTMRRRKTSKPKSKR